jgi:hypothetical protein
MVAQLATRTDQVVWTVTSVFVAAMALFLDTVASANGSARFFDAAIVSLAAFFVAVVWGIAFRRGAVVDAGEIENAAGSCLGHQGRAFVLPTESDYKTLVPDTPKAKPTLQMMAMQRSAG